jgi:hypothetical protein
MFLTIRRFPTDFTPSGSEGQLPLGVVGNRCARERKDAVADALDRGRH